MNNPKVNVVVSGHRNEYHSTYKTYILRGGIPFADQVIMPDTKYVIKYDFDLGGNAFDLNFSNADTHTVAEVTYYYIPFIADGSKYTLTNNNLIFIDAEWNGLSAREIKPTKGTMFMIASITGGLYKNGYGINVVTVPENCILEFDGGSLDNGVIVGQDTVFINVGDVDIWGENLTREGTWRENSYKVITPEQFGARGDGVTDDTQAFQDCIDAVYEAGGGDIILGAKTYIIDSIDLKVKTNLIGQGQGNTILKSLTDGVEGRGIINIPLYGTLCVISDLSVVGTDIIEGGITRHPHKDGINIQYGNPGNVVPDTSFRWQENRIDPKDVDITKTQTYRNITIQNVYVGECNFGIQCHNQAYRVNILCCDIKRCNYGIDFPNTDSSIHECYIERCKYDGLIVTGSNNSITNVKSIWNGAGDVVNCYGINIRGSRNRVSNCEAQDNYCSGIRVTGQQHIISNVMANTNGYIKSTGELTPEELAIETCEWYVNTMTTVFDNCVATSYSNRNNNHFPKYPVLYGAAHEDFGSRVKIMATTGTIIARDPIKYDCPLSISHIFDYDINNRVADKGYRIGSEILSSTKGSVSDVNNSINIAAILEIVPEDIITKQTVFRYGDYLSITLSVIEDETVTTGHPIKKLLAESGFGNVYPAPITLDHADCTKPIRFIIRSTFRGYNANQYCNIEGFFGAWYYNTSHNAYEYTFSRAVVTTNFTKPCVIPNNALFNASEVQGNTFYLRKLLVTNDVCLPDCVAYPGYPLNDIRPIMSFDYECLVSQPPINVTLVGFSDGINRIGNSAELVLLQTEDRVAGKWAQIVDNADMPATLVTVNHSLLPSIVNGIKLINAANSGHTVGTRVSLDTVKSAGEYVFSMQIKGSGTLYCAYLFYTGSGTRGKYLQSSTISNDDFEQYMIKFDLSEEYISAMKQANALFDFYVIIAEGDSEVVFCAPKIEKGNICTGWAELMNAPQAGYDVFMVSNQEENNN